MIDPAPAMDALLEELRRQKAAGVRRVSVSDESLAKLKVLAGESPKAAVQPASLTVMSKTRPVEASVGTPSVKAGPATAEKILTPPPVWQLPAGTKKEKMEWLREQVEQCPETRKHVGEKGKPLLGHGSLNAKVFIVGEAPNAEEVEAGRAFAGDAGDLLNKILAATGLTADDVYFSNLITWKPKAPTPFGKRPPRADEVEFNRPTLLAQVEIVKPQVIVAAGAQAFAALTGSVETITQKRGQWQEWAGIPMMPTFHPTYLLNSASNSSKRMVWEDFLQVMEKVGLPISAKQRAYFSAEPKIPASD